MAITTLAIKAAIDEAIRKAEAGEVTSMTRSGLGFADGEEFDDAAIIALYQALMDRFPERKGVIYPQKVAILLSKLPYQEVYLLGQTDFEGSFVYLIASKPSLDV